jgi:proline iminopeptidase
MIDVITMIKIMEIDMFDQTLFPPIDPLRSGLLAVDNLHTLYWEECGNPAGEPVIFLHGGPGGGISPQHRRFFDPNFYRIILFDQRGSGQSTPLGEFRQNTTQLLIGDIETLRMHLKIEQWLVFGGSWGSTLALAYGQAHPQRCTGFILRGIFLGTAKEIDWFMTGMRHFYPEVHDTFIRHIPPIEHDQLLLAYEKRLFSNDPEIYLPAARAWSTYEGSCVYLEPSASAIEEFGSDAVALGIGRLEAHYFLHQCFLSEDQLILGLDQIRHLPAVIVQGRYDVVCPPSTAYRLHTAWPEARLKMITKAGHAAMEPGTAAALVAATEQFKMRRAFD